MHHVLLIFFLSGFYAVSAEELCRKYDPDVDLNTPQIVRRHGYPSEAHVLASEDGYLLTLHRIPSVRNQARNGKAVYLQHGLLSSSSDFVLMGPNKALAFLLADQGYDVWMGNSRGNYYSKGHVSMSEENPKYWNFTWHEMGYYDLPAAIDYVLQISNPKSLFYVGHSMGTTMYFAMAASLPEYGSKVKAMFGLAPVAFLGHIKSPIRLLAPWAHDLQFLASYLGQGAFLPNNKIMRNLAKYGCETLAWEKEICSNALFIISGFDRPQFNMTLLPYILSHAPAGTSTKAVVHYAQLVNSGKFQQYDYGRLNNLKQYGTQGPAQYDLSLVRTPVALFYGDNDWLASITDVQHLYSNLRRKIGKFLVNFHGFNHIDFIYGIDARRLVYDQIINMLNSM